jgi:hypothetical protein
VCVEVVHANRDDVQVAIRFGCDCTESHDGDTS